MNGVSGPMPNPLRAALTGGQQHDVQPHRNAGKRHNKASRSQRHSSGHDMRKIRIRRALRRPITGTIEVLRHLNGWQRTALITLLVALGVVASIAVIAIPLEWQGQLLFGSATMLVAILLSKLSAHRLVTVGIAMASAIMSTRYIWWRANHSLDLNNPLEAILGSLLFAAEIYAWLILLLGYIQCTWPLKRPIQQLTGDPSTWPTVDVFIPTYNEDLEIVRDTVLAAMMMDYPKDRFKVWLLDDGRREEFRRFAEEAGCEYLIRPNNKGAKAGNLNHALGYSKADLVCVFDCDHIPTRAFLQMTVGWFQADPKMALVQTPHFMYTPDPVQRNVPALREVQAEGGLFYGLVQDGNDLWNATFFCGSCAILRRAALDDIGGFQEQTVTEDAHTSLCMHRKGWNSAYINLRLSAGLAVEKLALHIGQRARWARGMMQIFRIDNPMLGPGLKLGQRLCYFNAMLHFLFPLPRVIFLLAPLAYLLFGQNIISADPKEIIAYAIPHLGFAIIGNSRTQGIHNRGAWSEVYESILAFHLLGPSLLPLIDPKRGKFNVTDKGGLIEKQYIDWRSIKPHLISAILLTLGLSMGFWRLIIEADPDETATILLNMFWAAYSMIAVLMVIVVAREQKQVRKRLRMDFRDIVTLYLASGRTVMTDSIDISVDGIAVRTIRTDSPVVRIGIMHEGAEILVPVTEVGRREDRIAFRIHADDIETRRHLVALIYGKADRWIAPTEERKVSFAESIRDQMIAIVTLMPFIGNAIIRRLRMIAKRRALDDESEAKALREAAYLDIQPMSARTQIAVVAVLSLILLAGYAIVRSSYVDDSTEAEQPAAITKQTTTRTATRDTQHDRKSRDYGRFTTSSGPIL